MHKEEKNEMKTNERKERRQGKAGRQKKENNLSVEILRDHKFRLVSLRVITTEVLQGLCFYSCRGGCGNLNLKESKTKVRSKNFTKTFSIAKPSSEGSDKDANGKTWWTKTNSY